MNPSTFVIVIGIINGFFYMMISGVAIAKLVQLWQMVEKSTDYATTMASTMAILIYSLVMTLLSGLLIVGVKKRRSRLIAPWVFLGAIGIAGLILYLFIAGYKLQTWEIFSKISFIASQTLIWYAVYAFWRDLLKDESLLTPYHEEVQ